MVRHPLSKRANKYLRKFSKWPHSPYKTSWHHNFGEQQALHKLKQATLKMGFPQTPNLPHPLLLSTLLDSFKSYSCDPTPKAYYFVIKTLTSTSQFQDIPPVLDHLEHLEKFETPEFILVYLIRFYGLSDKKRECLKMVPEILLNSQHMNIRVEESTFQVLIKALCRIKRVGYAIKMLNYMIEGGYGLDETICSLIISSLCEQEDMTSVEALVIWRDMGKLGFCPGIMDYTNMIRFLVKEGKGMDALDILNQQKKDGIKPNVVCYTMVLSGIVAEGEHVKLEELFDEILVFGLVPDVYTYNVYINAEDLRKARGVMKEMGWKGVGLNLHSYRLMLVGLVGEGEIGEACFLLEEMLEKCFFSRSSTFDHIIFQMCQKSLIAEAIELTKKIVAKSFVPGARAWEALLLKSGYKLGISETTFSGFIWKEADERIDPIITISLKASKQSNKSVNESNNSCCAASCAY
ncbi:hypothetical protein VNO80_07448 [Phaseolus coccineus]|uniref:Pentatricopeptide repeat-containing protein n=1 Tax=Phaseolus coccineus TaxID=3886 RepID=A0AAN9NIZ9_PHACN